MTQFLRTNHDAILIGAGTANADNPGLNTSFSYDGKTIVGLAEQPRPLILDPGQSWKPDSCEKMFRLTSLGLGRAPWIIFSNAPEGDEALQAPRGIRRRVGYTSTTGEVDMKAAADRLTERIKKVQGVGGKFIRAGNYGKSEDGVEWEKILKAMWDNGIRSVMIEGGATVINDLLRARNQHLVTSVIVTVAPTYLGSGGVVVAPPRSVQDENEARLNGVTWIPFGQDVVMAGRLAPKS
jgi:2,5-diamino-6-(ribosylamino)-4(3H)-pyrimidinone 5'-phosphate reductase